jgi:hypothetical protein
LIINGKLVENLQNVKTTMKNIILNP